MWIQSLGWEDPLEKGIATHSSILDWEMPWTEEPSRLQPMGLQRVGHNWATKTFALLTWCSCDLKILQTFREETLTQSGSVYLAREMGGQGRNLTTKKIRARTRDSSGAFFLECELHKERNLSFWKNNLTFSWVDFTANKPTLTWKKPS